VLTTQRELKDLCEHISDNFPNSLSALEATEQVWTVDGGRKAKRTAPHRTNNPMQMTKGLNWRVS
jgi:hypothetical protein